MGAICAAAIRPPEATITKIAYMTQKTGVRTTSRGVRSTLVWGRRRLLRWIGTATDGLRQQERQQDHDGALAEGRNTGRRPGSRCWRSSWRSAPPSPRRPRRNRLPWHQPRGRADVETISGRCRRRCRRPTRPPMPPITAAPYSIHRDEAWELMSQASAIITPPKQTTMRGPVAIDEPGFHRHQPCLGGDEDREGELDRRAAPVELGVDGIDEERPAILQVGDHRHAENAEGELPPFGGWCVLSFHP